MKIKLKNEYCDLKLGIESCSCSKVSVASLTNWRIFFQWEFGIQKCPPSRQSPVSFCSHGQYENCENSLWKLTGVSKWRETGQPCCPWFCGTWVPVHITIVSVQKCFLLASLFFMFRVKWVSFVITKHRVCKVMSLVVLVQESQTSFHFTFRTAEQPYWKILTLVRDAALNLSSKMLCYYTINFQNWNYIICTFGYLHLFPDRSVSS